MKKRIVTIVCGGALLLSPLYAEAEPYMLSCNLVSSNQTKNKGSRAPKRPLVVDLEGHTLTVPDQVIGYTLTLENENGEFYTYGILGTTFELPHDLSGFYKLVLRNNETVYEGSIDIIN